MKIAVCFSGEPRTWKAATESIKAFYSGDHEFYLFGHIWSNNTPGNHIIDVVPDALDPILLEKELRNAFEFTTLNIEPHKISPNIDNHKQHEFGETITGKQHVMNIKIPITWCSPFYSAMMSNHYKYAYEQANDMSFDLVIRARLDVCYTPGTTINSYLPLSVLPHALYCNLSSFKREYMSPAINDTFYFGSSHNMDIVDSFYRTYHSGEFFKMIHADDYFDAAYKSVGPGVFLYKWLTIKNILPVHSNFHQMPVIRKTAEDLIWPHDFNKIMEAYVSW